MFRFLIAISALFFLYMAVQPCHDEFASGCDIAIAESHEHEPVEADHCTPLCTCNCCSTSLDEGSPHSYHHQAFSSRHHYNGISLNPPQEITLAIWQPPQLS